MEANVIPLRRNWRRSGRGRVAARPSPTQQAWLKRGLDQPGGKLPIFDREGQPISPRTIRSCIARGWAEPWFANPIKPDWLVCKLTAAGRTVVTGEKTSA